MKPVLAILTCLALPILAAESGKQIQSISKTENFSGSAPGTIRIPDSHGDINIEGWDRSEVEVTITRSSPYVYTTAEKDQATRLLDKVKVAAKQEGNDLNISTVYPALNGLTHMFDQRDYVAVEYRIKAPRATKFIIDHNSGEVNISDITGDIQATAHDGQITLDLPDAPYAIDAKSKCGSVYSDFDGKNKRRHLLGDQFDETNGQATRHLNLHITFGDILILKMHTPPTE